MENISEEVNVLKTALKLTDLPNEILTLIFSFCDLPGLGRLSTVCTKFNDVISEEFLWQKRCSNLITSQNFEVISRSYKLLNSKEKCRIAINWKVGFFNEDVLAFRGKYMPHLLLERDCLWLSQGNRISLYRRTENGVKNKIPSFSFSNGHTEDVRKFVKANDVMYSCGLDGVICGWSITSGQLLFKTFAHVLSVYSIDVNKQILVTGSKDMHVKIWYIEDDVSGCRQTLTLPFETCVWCVAINPSGSQVACCSSVTSEFLSSLHIYDMERQVLSEVQSLVVTLGATMYDAKWESDDILLTCGYDSFIRLFDMRVGRCVAIWMDPLDVPGYCLATDKENYILCGTSRNGRAQLFDKRVTGSSLQSYFSFNRDSSPVYSLAFDASTLFLAQDRSMNVLDFSRNMYRCNRMQRKDFRSLWSNRIVIY